MHFVVATFFVSGRACYLCAHS